MLKNYFIVALRAMARQKFHAFINILGLSTSLTSVILIMLYVTHERSFDTFHAGAERIYRVVENQYYSGEPVFPVAVTPAPLGESLMQEFPEVESAVRLRPAPTAFMKNDERIVEQGAYADPSFFRVFTFALPYGDKKTALTGVNRVVISKTLAAKYFGTEDAVGKLLRTGNREFEVTGVMEDMPDNSQFTFDFLLSMATLESVRTGMNDGWGSNFLYTYIGLKKDASAATLNEKIKDHIKKFNEGSAVELFLQPLTDVHLGEISFTADLGGKGNRSYVRIFSVVAVLTLLIACINFMNLATARSMKRAREVGLRKTVGASRLQLIIQFLSESVLITGCSLLLSLIFIRGLLPLFNLLTEKQFTFQSLLLYREFLVGIGGVVIATGVLAGSYPAFYLSAFRPVNVLKGKFEKTTDSSLFRKALVVLQFSISTFMIAGTLVVLWQMQFIKNTNLGYDRENVVTIPAISNHYESFKAELTAGNAVLAVTTSNQDVLNVGNSSSGFDWHGKVPDQTVLFHTLRVNYDFTGTMRIGLKEGRDFSPLNRADSAAVIINQQAASVLGFDEPLGARIRSGDNEFTIIGVTEDFNFKSVHSRIEPLLIFLGTDDRLDEHSLIRTAEGTAGEALALIEATWKKFNPGSRFTYSFMDADFDNLYKAEARTGVIFRYFAALAVLISCLGLFGLTSYTAEQRAKEFSIRKVLGASLLQLFSLASTRYIVLVLTAFVLSIPVCWYVMDRWLSVFAYRITIDYRVFLLSGCMVLFIALLTVSWQAVRSAMTNPVDTLRSE